jgi:hypothetical protein
MSIVNPTRFRIREAQRRIAQARERTELSMESVLQTANRILTFQLQRPDLALARSALYEHMVTPPATRFPDFPRATRES